MNDTHASSVPAWPVVSLREAERLLTLEGARFEIEERLIRGVPIKVWKNALPTLREVFLLARQYGTRTFLVYENERVSFEAFHAAVLTLAHALQADGVKPGDRVAVIMRNLPEWPVAYFAIVLCGAIATPLNAWWNGSELAYGLSDSGSSVAIVDAERYQRIENQLAGCAALTRIYVTRAKEVPGHPLVRALDAVLGPVDGWASLPERALPDVAIDPEQDATIFYTSGTTGRAKGAIATHRNGVTNVMTQGFAFARAMVRRGETPVPPSPSDPQRVALLAVPMFHVTGCNSTLIPGLYLGTKLVLMRKWDPELAMQLIEREGVTSAGGVPTIAWQLLEHPARAKYDLSSLAFISYGGAPAAPELLRQIRAVFPQASAGNSWGMTETSGTFTSNYGEDYEQRPDSCGRPAAVGELKIMSADGSRELPTGEVGELWARGPQVIRGYWGKPEATAETFVDGWVKTGDVARLDEEGFCFIVDRAKDILIRGGENIYCIQVESALYEHPLVMDAAVVGIPHRILGEEPGAVVHLKPDAALSEAELQAFLKTRLAAYEVPVRILFWPEPLPRNAAGKIVKRDLKPAFQA